MPSKTTTFEVQGEAPDFGKVPDFKAGTYKKGDLIRNTEDFKVYRAKKKIEVKQFNANDWESTDVFYEVELRLPGFKEVQMGLAAMTTTTGNLDIAGGGNIIIELCRVKISPELLRPENVKYYLSLALAIGNKYLETVDVRIKKN